MSARTTSVAMHWIDGKRVDSDEHRDSVNPATGEVIGSYAMGGPKEAQAAIEAAKRAFADPAWRTSRLLRVRGDGRLHRVQAHPAAAGNDTGSLRRRRDHMSTAVIGVGNIGKAVAGHLTAGGEAVVLAAGTPAQAEQLARELGAPASAADVADAIEQADAVIFAVWLNVLEDLVRQNATRLAGKVVIDPSNPIAPDGKGGFVRTLPDGVSAGSVVSGLLPSGAHFVKAFGTVGAEKLADAANRSPQRAVLFYATDDDVAASTAERLISAAGFDPVKAGGLDQAIRIEMFGDLHDFGGLNGRLLTVEQARALLASTRG